MFAGGCGPEVIGSIQKYFRNIAAALSFRQKSTLFTPQYKMLHDAEYSTHANINSRDAAV